MDESKWIQGLEPSMPVVQAARHVLALRLQAVAARLGPALRQTDDDPEHIHQLRVSTRRAAAAVRIFVDCLPGKHHRHVRKLLRRLRRAAGDIRDWDVFLEGLAAHSVRVAANMRPGLDFLLGFAQGKRSAARAQLLENISDTEKDLDKIGDDALAALTSTDHHAKLGELAKSTLAVLLDDLAAAAAQNLEDYAHLHRVRIFGKRLRYAMEVFSSCFPKNFHGPIYAAIEQMQEILGQANDSHVAVEHLDALCTFMAKSQPRSWQRLRAGVDRLVKFHQRRLDRQRRQFLMWWKKWCGSRPERALRRMLQG